MNLVTCLCAHCGNISQYNYSNYMDKINGEYLNCRACKMINYWTNPQIATILEGNYKVKGLKQKPTHPATPKGHLE